jgi:uncharacterized protein YerC
MSQVSRYPVSKDVYLKSFEIFLKTISRLNTRREVAKFLGEFFTPTEKIMFVKRLAISFLIEKKYDYREISKILRVSTGTINRVSIFYGESIVFKKMIRSFLKEEEIEEFWLNIGEKVTSALASGKSKSGSWFYLREELRRKRRNKPF